ncbi:hypothetical protein SETIT_7G003900v2 [Setaria italica]|uniref:AAA+ ATPase domain-containing protein n=1 Tax=Setaria italica TaxID=4555 RepID=K3Y4W6_SETIT|nr:disease resistance protein RPM1-like [Setaria italica]XP_022683656.1 disease resistance protein RPM1-like [Setaria italica]XP_022683657.1 disease resistance protein RPM1-like [Setaria italica]XP_022683658.1 disease resistance protein RPM1-like [Setaria italica]RCV32450.1 hypothetical protein SETIT_7G003900v2 [Setaria italica]
MDLVVGASESTVKSLLGKLGSLLAQDYTLIRGVGRDLQYITDELRTMQSFLRDLGDAEQDHRMKDWMKQIRDMTYDVEDCVDDSGNRIHNPRWLRGDICCYFLVSNVYEVLTWWPRRDIAGKISDLKVRAQQISERRQRYGVNNPEAAKGKNSAAEGFDAAGNQDRSLALVAAMDPVGVDEFMEKLEHWVNDETKKAGVLSIVGYGGVGKTRIATALYKKLGDQFGCRAMVTVSQSSNIEAILDNIRSQVKPESNKDHERHGRSEESRLAAALEGLQAQIRRGKSTIKAKCRCLGTAQETEGGTKRNQLNDELKGHFQENSYLVVIDDVWSATTLENIRKAFPQTDKHSHRGRIIVTTRFPAVATARRGQEGDHVHKVVPLSLKKSMELFNQAYSESKPSQNVSVPDEVWKVCGGLPLAIVAMSGYAACNSHKHLKWDEIYTKLFPDKKRREELKSGDILNSTPAEAGKDTRKGLTQEELGRIVSHCYNDMPAEIITCSLYLSIFPKGSRISRKRLIRRWIAEGFVSEKDGMSVEDVAETYFGHLVRRKMIRSVEHSNSGKIKQCVVHDMVLEHIVSKASEENFITVVGGHWLMHPPSSKVRRLSLQGSDPKRAKDTEKMNLSHVRSLTMFESLKQLPSNSFKFGTIVQVLDLEGCTDIKEQHAKEICGMFLLKYLSLRRTDTKELPKAIGKLQNLETLDIRETKIVKLPKEVCSLERLINILGGDKETRRALKLPEEFVKKQKMKGLRVLSGIGIVGELEDLHHLTDLRKLAIYKLELTGDSANLKLSSSIQYLCGYSLHTLVIHDESSKFLKCLDEMTSPPESLIALELCGMMVQLPVWITQLDAVTKLTLSITALRTDNLSKLSNLKTLFSLTFTLAAEKQGPEIMAILAKNKLFSDGHIVFPDGGFENLKLLRLCAPVVPLVSFMENAMAKLERLEVRFKILEGIYGVENLARLEEMYLRLNDKDGEAMTNHIVEEMKSAVREDPANKSVVRIIFHITTTD